MQGPPQTPRQRPGYDAERDGTSRQGSIGNHILKPGVDAVVKKPSWKGKESVFRPYPCLNYEDPANAFEPFRRDPANKALFGDWIRRYDVAWSVGNPATTFLLHDPSQHDPFYDPWTTPLGILYRAIEGACKAGQGRGEWQILREGATGKGKALAPPKEAYFMQGVLVKYDDKPTFLKGKAPLGWGPNPPVVFMLSGGAGRKLAGVLGEENEGIDYLAPPEDRSAYTAYFEKRYKHGDPVAVESGRYFHFFEKGHDPRERYLARPTTRADSPFGTGGFTTGRDQGADDEEFRGFDLFITKDGNMNLPATLNEPGQLEILRSKWRWWEDILFFPSYIEQAHLLCDIFPASACIYAFESVDSDWISEKARKKLVQAHSASVPAGVPGQSALPAGYNPLGVPAQPGYNPLSGPAPAAEPGLPGVFPPTGPVPPAEATPPGYNPFGPAPQPLRPAAQAPVVPAQPAPQPVQPVAPAPAAVAPSPFGPGGLAHEEAQPDSVVPSQNVSGVEQEAGLGWGQAPPPPVSAADRGAAAIAALARSRAVSKADTPAS